jgi:hypothetical protein
LYVVLASAGRRGQENRNKTQMINHGRVFMMTLYQAHANGRDSNRTCSVL